MHSPVNSVLALGLFVETKSMQLREQATSKTEPGKRNMATPDGRLTSVRGNSPCVYTFVGAPLLRYSHTTPSPSRSFMNSYAG